MKTLQTIQDELRNLIPEGNDRVIAALKAILKPGTDKHNDFLALEGRYQETNRQLILGVISQDDATLEFNKVRLSLIAFIEGLQAADIPGLETAASVTEGGLADVQNGEVLYRIPKKMQLGAESECIVRLSFDRKTLLHDFQVQVGDVVKDLRISDVMGVELIDTNADKAFSITTLNETVQFVDKGITTEWIFCVTPLKQGHFPLVLRISVIEMKNGIERKRQEVLKEQVEILTEKPVESMPDFVSAGYSWQVTGTDEQRAIPGAGKGVEAPSPMPSSPSPAAPAPSQGGSKAARGLAFGLFGKVMAGVAALVIGTVAVMQVLPNKANDTPSVAEVRADDFKKLRGKANRRELEDFRRENPGTAEDSMALAVLDSLENGLWREAVASNDFERMQDYLNEYPSGIHANEAATRMDEINRSVEAVVQPDSLTLVQDTSMRELPNNPIRREEPRVADPSKPRRNRPTPPPGSQTPPSRPRSNTSPPRPNTSPARPSTPSTTTAEPAPARPAPVDPNRPVSLVSASRKPVFKNCGDGNRSKEEKCTNNKIYNYLSNGFEYPEAARQKRIQGKVVVSFVVERDGSITDVKALNDLGGGCANEAVRLIKKLPKFKPGLNGKGEPIRVQYTQPVTFKLE